MDSRSWLLNKFLSICNYYSNSVAISNVLNLENGFGITFSELNQLTNDLSKFFIELFGTAPQYVGIELSNYFFLPSLIIAIWKNGFSFAGASNQYSAKSTLNYLNFLEVKYMITDSIEFKYNGKIISTFYIYNQKFFIWGREIEIDINKKDLQTWDFCYGIMTSGTTGVTKIIQVPWSCILPNAVELCQEFQVLESDCIFLASPCTFDPFFIELFLFLLSGCRLLIVPNHVKLCSSTLLKILFSKDNLNCEVPVLVQTQTNCKNYFYKKVTKIRRKPVTFLQMTPSFFKRWNDEEIKDFILSSNSMLKTLVLGGEIFPKEILNLKSLKNKTRIYNIYGITEISCWAFLNEISQNFSGTEFSLGKKLNDINFKIFENGELIIGSKTRICLVNNENISDLNANENVFRNTGDVVEVKNENIFFISRLNQIVKKYGIKICLKNIEEAFLKVNDFFRNVFCLYDETNMKIGIFFLLIKPSIELDYKQITYEEFINRGYFVPKNILKSIEKPDYFIEIAHVPVNMHGKCNKEKMFQYLKSISNLQKNTLNLNIEILNIFNEVLGCKESVDLTKSFTELGGTSVMALQIISKVESMGFKVPPNFIVNLLNKKNLNCCIDILLDQSVKNELTCKKIKIHNLDSFLKVSVKWKFDLNKCIDATPTVITYLGKRKLFVGSHSSKLACIDSESGSSIWTISLGDRIESRFTITKDKSQGIIGCYNGFVYCLSVEDGKLLWKYKTGDMVKSTPCLSSDEKVVFASSYDGYLYCLSVDNGALLKKLQISEKGIFSTGLISTDLKTFFIATLDGICLALCENLFQERWRKKLKSPIFASPCLLKNNFVVVAEVSGVVHCFNMANNFTAWKYVTKGFIYSSPTSFLLENVELILFGCYDHCIYCLENGEEVKLKWKQNLGCAIFGKLSVFILNSSYVACAAATTEGFVYFCNCKNGEILQKIKLDGEVFSSPIYADNELFVGCRDNNVYGLKILINESSI